MKQQIHTSPSGIAPDIAAPSGLFDNKAASTARPVVPLETSEGRATAAAPHRSWLVAAIAVSAIIGSLTGIAAFSLYQRRQADKINASQFTAAPATATTQPIAVSPEVVEPVTITNAASMPEKTETSSEETNSKVEPGVTRTATDTSRVAPITASAPSSTNSAARTERRESETTKPTATKPATTETVAKRPSREERKEPQPRAVASASEAKPAARDERPAPAAERPAPTRERRAQRNETSTERGERPGYVDAVRRAIGDRPVRSNRRAGDANGERVREIFEGQPPRR